MLPRYFILIIFSFDVAVRISAYLSYNFFFSFCFLFLSHAFSLAFPSAFFYHFYPTVFICSIHLSVHILSSINFSVHILSSINFSNHILLCRAHHAVLINHIFLSSPYFFRPSFCLSLSSPSNTFSLSSLPNHTCPTFALPYLIFSLSFLTFSFLTFHFLISPSLLFLSP
jgi:hypothetical protein